MVERRNEVLLLRCVTYTMLWQTDKQLITTRFKTHLSGLGMHVELT